jgi:DNA-binding MarR family transcriptional regulator
MPAPQSKKRSTAVARPAESAFRELIRTFGLVERVMQPYFARHGISGSQWGVLRNLHRAEGEGLPGLRLTDLSDRLLLRPPSVSGVIDRLERAGLVQRGGSPTDLRAKRVALTSRGRDLVEHVLVGHSDQIEAVMAAFDTADHTELYRLLHQWSKHLEGLLEQQASVNIA